MKQEKFVGTFMGSVIEADSKKEYVINALTKLYEKNKHLSASERLNNYIISFISEFSYDKNLRNDLIDANEGLDFDQTEDLLFKLIYEGEGVCQQLSQALSLLTQIDLQENKDACVLYYTNVDIDLNGADVGHAFNVTVDFTNGRVARVVDISSMIHARDKDYNQQMIAFFARPTKEYYANMKKEGVKIKPDEKGTIEVFPNVITEEGKARFMTADEYYRLLNRDPEMLENTSPWNPIFEKDEDIESSI